MHRTKIYFPVIILSLSGSGYPTVPIKFGYTGSWRRVITPIHADTTVYIMFFSNKSVFEIENPYQFLRDNNGVIAINMFIYQGG